MNHDLENIDERFGCRTMGGTSPVGKARVYFTCNPMDFDGFFDGVCKDIFHCFENCAIYYNAKRTISWSEDEKEEAEISLNQIQLFIVVITSKFFSSENENWKFEIQYALSKNKTILPLMMETNLEKKYSAVFGTRHFLDRSSEEDETVLPYGTKLKEFLDSVLVDNNMANDIKKAFAYQIFLSYRKEDRREAQEFMRMVHEYEFCRDVAIWYDEFLIASRPFEKEIKHAMEESNIFALIVTPNVVKQNKDNEENYVITTEYPMADEMEERGEIKILPLEMQPTDREALNSKMKKILPRLINKNDVAGLEKFLLDSGIKADSNDDPNHLYLIGLAYLNGINVEVNTNKGVQLIQMAAESDSPDAIYKMAQMYKNGEGVEVDFEKSSIWLGKLENFREKCLRDDPSDNNKSLFCEALFQSGNSRMDMGRFNEARDSFLRLKEFAERMATVNRTLDYGSDDNEYIEQCYAQLGELSLAEGKISEAEDWYKKNYDFIRQKLPYININDVYKRLYKIGRLSYLCQKLVRIFLEQENLSEAENWAQESVECYELFAILSGGIGVTINLAASYKCLGDVFKDGEDLSEAIEMYIKGKDYLNPIVEDTENIEAKRSLFTIYLSLGDTFMLEGEYPQASEQFLNAYELADDIAKKTGLPYDHYLLAVIQERLGDVCLGEEDTKEAIKWQKMSLKEKENIYEKINSAEIKQSLSCSYSNISAIYKFENDLTTERKYLDQCCILRESIFQEYGTEESQYDLAEVYCFLSESYCIDCDFFDAKIYLEKGFPLINGLAAASQFPKVPHLVAQYKKILHYLVDHDTENSEYLLWLEDLETNQD